VSCQRDGNAGDGDPGPGNGMKWRERLEDEHDKSVVQNGVGDKPESGREL